MTDMTSQHHDTHHPHKPTHTESSSISIRELLKIILIVLAIVVPIRTLVAQPFIVNGQSMYPTFDTNQYVIVDRLSYNFAPPQRGDVIVFKYPNDPSRFFIKRIIGLPGEKVVFEDTNTKIINKDHPEGIILDEPYINQNTILYQENQLGDDEYFVLGDNRGASSDSRFWGPLPKNLIVGRAILRILPPGKAGFYPGDERGSYKNDTATKESLSDQTTAKKATK